MTKHIKTTIRIHADKDSIWQILTDFDRYPEWNPFINELSGEVKVGNQIMVKLQGMTFKPLVLAFTKNKEFRWLGHLLFKGLFDGEHKFYLTDMGDGTTLFEQSESFKGILVRLFAKRLDKDTKSGFEQMNMALKDIAEKTAEA